MIIDHNNDTWMIMIPMMSMELDNDEIVMMVAYDFD